ncbi:uncharacterized protein LOC112506085 [Cynara cardunculus var. scolymus]|uniref:J domain-containing protein n=1 Tax=Cynara cardunculus var. scolymus TaxID=59895 RepID=A0A103YJA6_CYNCS|nr:uncharacterized protein LOC112506085 [Cynara cardunculus var. scolymus]XP_024965889.1 uncharacterized protein LOC112506085 [Cynara cardunculus var. scolymus]KVI10174.1 hypothetical protein Ccrd_011405 [Cynara cardunculus var. scolymus]
MECNRDEAIRAKTIAEKRLADKDFTSAKKFALKAQTLYPELDGIAQMFTTLDVYISAEKKVSGEVDWYGILGVNPSDDDDTIRKQYRKLALILHPDKNKSVGADGAFKLLSEAWSLLSDKAKRLAYNHRRSLSGSQQKVSSQSGDPSAASGVNSFHNLATSKPKSRRTITTARMGPASVFPPVPPPAPDPDPPPVIHRDDTFWTICHRCKMHYEYLKVYLNHTLLCPNCHEPFLAKETAPPVNFSWSAHQQHHDLSISSKPATNQYNPRRSPAAAHNSEGAPSSHRPSNNTNSFLGPFSGTNLPCNTDPSIALKAANVVQRVNERLRRDNTDPTSIASKAANIVQRVNEKLRREREELSAGWPSKDRKVDNSEQSSYSTPYQMSMGNDTGNISRLRTTVFETDGAYGFYSMSNKINSTRELSPLEIRNMLMQKAQKEICRKISEWLSEEEVEENKADHTKTFTGSNGNGNCTSSIKKGLCQTMDTQEHQEPAMMVPDPDFHNFDLDRTENSFQDNQVWAAYDDEDGMPRFYALVHKVLSRNPLKMKISWLNSKTTTEFGQIDWIGCGFRKTCGEFRVGRHEFYKSLNSFSQKVEWTKTPRGSVLIYPRKGEVWALYRNWSRDWNEHIPDNVIHQYEMVEVVDDYNEEQGVAVSPLVKFAGFRTVFHPRTEQSEVKKILKEEMFRFSHQVPKYLLTGEEAHNSPKGCLELDPAATSVNEA